MSKLEVVPNKVLLIDLIHQLDDRISALEGKNPAAGTVSDEVVEVANGTFNAFKDGKFVGNFATREEAEKAA